MSPFHTTCPSAECINRPPIAHTWEISQVHCRERANRTDTRVLAEGHGTWRLNESNLDPSRLGDLSGVTVCMNIRWPPERATEHQGGLFLYRYL